MRSTMIRCLGAAVLASLLLAAGPASAAGPISVGEYVKRADKVCRAGDRALREVPAPTTQAQLAPYFTQLVAAATPYVQKLQAIPLPTTKRGTVRTLRRLTAQQLEIINQANARVQAGQDVQGVLQSFDKELSRIEKSQDRRWKQLGAKVCGKD